MSDSQLVESLSPREHLETCGHIFGFTTGEEGLLVSLYGPGMLLNILQYQDSLHHYQALLNYLGQMSVVPWLENPDVD